VCGIFAYTGPAAPDPAVLADAATGAAQRGPHGHGWAGHRVTPHYALGPLSVADTAAITGPRVIGHARLATTGAHDDPDGLQPISVCGHLVAHNGVITNPHELAGAPPHGTDSRALAHAYAHHRSRGAPPVAALAFALVPARHDTWAVVVLDASGVLVAHRHGLPLWQATHPTGAYLSSRPLATVPAMLVPPDQTLVLQPAPLARALVHTAA